MVAAANLVEVAALVGDTARATILAALMGGQALTGSELAYLARVSRPTASEHLLKLVEARLVAVTKQGRYRYYRIASPLVARMLESIIAVAAIEVPSRYQPRSIRDDTLRFARTCYDHLAGQVGVAVTDALIANGHIVLTDDGGEVTEAGTRFLTSFGADLRPGGKRVFCRPCLDWSERRYHVAGLVGAQIWRRCLDPRRLFFSAALPDSSRGCRIGVRPNNDVQIAHLRHRAHPRAFRALWIAEELGLDYEHVPVEIGAAGARKPDYLAINPNGRLPAIEDDGFILWESLAITLYLAKKHGRLYPTTLEGEAKAWQWSLWAVQEVDRGVNIWSLHAVRLPVEDRDPQRLAEALKVLEPPLKVLDGALAGRPYLLGEDFTVADLNVAAVISRAIDMDLAATPRLAAWLKRCLERPAARTARALRAKADAAVPVEVTRAIARHNRL